MRFFSRAEIAGFIIAVLGVAVMGVISFTGPYNHINKTQAKTAFPAVAVNIATATGAQANQIGLYKPKAITVHIGQPVTFTNNSNAAHTVTANNGTFDSLNLGQKSSWTYTPTKAGTFPYHCQYHPLMLGTLVVH